ncbi:hypothetical protein DSECCO2_661100 [anaerobic digester metagenome]
MEFMQTDFPEPVAPAMSRCGILAMFVMTRLPEISRPSATVTLLFASANSGESTTSRRVTGVTLRFGTSMPTASLFGIGASIRTPAEARFSAISSARLVILEILTPAEG